MRTPSPLRVLSRFGHGLSLGEPRLASTKVARTYNRVAMYDFDGTLFRSWEATPSWWEETGLDNGPFSFFVQPQSLDEPCVPDRPSSEYWIERSVRAAQQDTRDRSTLLVLITGRVKSHRPRVLSLLRQKEIVPDLDYFNPGMSAAKFKVAALKTILAGHNTIDEVAIWENENQSYYRQALLAVGEALGRPLKIDVNSINEAAVPLACGVQDFVPEARVASSSRIASRFREELQMAINRTSRENGSDTPDFILAEYLEGCLENFDRTVQQRERWYGRGHQATDQLPGGLADEKDPSDFDQRQLEKGTRVEREHADDRDLAQEIAMDHLVETPDYYTRLMQVERRASIRTAAEKGDGSEVGIMIPLPADLAKQFPKKPEDNSAPHVTFLYIGKVPKGKEKVLTDAVARFFQGTGPVRAVLTQLDRFFSQEKKVVFSRIRFSRDLAPIRKALWDYLLSEGFEVEDSFPNWSPHTTITYLDPHEEWRGTPPRGAWTFDSVEIWGLPQKKSVTFVEEALPLPRLTGAPPETGERRMARIMEKRANAALLQSRWASRRVPLMVLRGWASALNRSVTCPLGDVTAQEVQAGLDALLDFKGDNPDYWGTFIQPGGRYRQILDSDDLSFICRHIQHLRARG